MALAEKKSISQNEMQADEQLERVLNSACFSGSPRQQELLQYLVYESLVGNSYKLKGYTIGVEVFGRGADFDPAVDAIVRVEVGRLRSRLRDYYAEEGRDDPVRFELPKGGYVVRFKMASGKPSGPAATPRVGESLLHEKPSLAVLPLANLSGDVTQDYFADGITDSLIFGLSRLSGLRVISRQTSFAYRNSTQSSESIAQALGVKYLLQGSVQRSSQMIRVTVQLVEASSGGHILSERFDRDIQDIFAVQDEIAQSIASGLQVKLAPAEAALFGHEGTSSVEAHESLLKGLECHWKYTPMFIAEACRHFSRAVERDPAYAAAHAWLARSILHQWMMRWVDGPELKEKALDHAEKAVALNPQLPYALAILGWVHLWYKNREPAISYCRKAVSLDANNPELLNFLSMVLSSAGYGEEALFYIEKARQFNPHSSPFYEFVLGQAYFVLEDYDKAIAAYSRGCELSETFIPNYVFLCTTYALLGMDEDMHKRREQVMVLIGGDQSNLIETPWLDERLAAFYDHLRQLADLI